MNIAEEHFAIVRAQLLLEMTEFEFDNETELPVTVALYASVVALWISIRSHAELYAGGVDDEWLGKRCEQATANVLAIEAPLAADAELRYWLRGQRWKHEREISLEKLLTDPPYISE